MNFMWLDYDGSAREIRSGLSCSDDCLGRCSDTDVGRGEKVSSTRDRLAGLVGRRADELWAGQSDLSRSASPPWSVVTDQNRGDVNLPAPRGMSPAPRIRVRSRDPGAQPGVPSPPNRQELPCTATENRTAAVQRATRHRCITDLSRDLTRSTHRRKLGSGADSAGLQQPVQQREPNGGGSDRTATDVVCL